MREIPREVRMTSPGGFSDEDLRKMKEYLPYMRITFHGDPLNLEGLVARLEAAENALEQAYRCTPENREYYERWKKIAGKEREKQ